MHYLLEIPAALESLRIAAPFTTAVLQELPEIRDRDRIIRELTLVASEAVTNALCHGSVTGLTIRLEYDLAPDAIIISVTDYGSGFDLETVVPPDLVLFQEGGYGVYIMKSIMDVVSYEKTDDGNYLVLRKSWERQ